MHIGFRLYNAIKVGRELTVRALATGLLLGAALTPSDVYSGLERVWPINAEL
jgi:hypothetical protein